MSLAITVTDAANGGGVQVDVTGSAGTVTVRYFNPADGTWSDLGTIGNDGPVNGTVTPGLYWWVANDVLSFPSTNTLSNIVPKIITRSSQAVYDQCLEAVKTTLQLEIDAGYLPGINGVHRQRRLRIDSMEDSLPALVVCPANPNLEPVTNERDQLTYPVQVFVLDTVSNQEADDEENNSLAYHLINERVRRSFSQQRLAGVTRVDVCRVQLGNHFEWLANGYELVQSVILVNCLTRETRGAS